LVHWRFSASWRTETVSSVCLLANFNQTSNTPVVTEDGIDGYGSGLRENPVLPYISCTFEKK
jgi:hypothetical protein